MADKDFQEFYGIRNSIPTFESGDISPELREELHDIGVRPSKSDRYYIPQINDALVGAGMSDQVSYYLRKILAERPASLLH